MGAKNLGCFGIQMVYAGTQLDEIIKEEEMNLDKEQGNQELAPEAFQQYMVGVEKRQRRLQALKSNGRHQEDTQACCLLGTERQE